MKKRILSIVLALAMVFAFSAVAFAEGGLLLGASKANVAYVTMTNAGELAITKDGKAAALLPVEVAEGATIQDVLKAFHETYFKDGVDGFGVLDTEYGPSVSKLWGVETSGVGYYVNGAMAWSLADPVKAGDVVDAWIYKDQVGWSDQFLAISSVGGEGKASFEVKAAGYDADWNVVMQPLEGASIYLIGADGKLGSKIATSDANGKAEAKLAAGEYTIVCAKEGTIFGACSVSVAAPAVEPTPVAPATGMSFAIYAVAAVSAIGAVIATKKAKKEE